MHIDLLSDLRECGLEENGIPAQVYLPSGQGRFSREKAVLDLALNPACTSGLKSSTVLQYL